MLRFHSQGVYVTPKIARHSPKSPRILMTLDRTKRVRQTREEAKKESEEYRQSTEKKYRAYEAEVCPSLRCPTASWPIYYVPYASGPIEQFHLHTPPHQHSQGNTAAEENALKEAQGEIKSLQASGEKGKSDAIEELLQAVRDAQPEPADIA